MAQVSLKTYQNKIREDIKAGEFDQAIVTGQHILRYYPKHYPTYLLLAEACLGRGLNEEAADLALRALSVDPENVSARIALSKANEAMADIDEAVAQMRTAFDLAPSNRQVRAELHRLVASQTGQEAPNMKLTRSGLGRIYVRGGLGTQAADEFEALLRDDPEQADVEASLAETLWRDGQHIRSIEVCQSLLSKLPYSLKANLILAETWMRSDRQDEAEAHLNVVRELDPEGEASYQVMGEASPVSRSEVALPPLGQAGAVVPDTLVSGVTVPLAAVGGIAAAAGVEELEGLEVGTLPEWLRDMRPQELETAPGAPGAVAALAGAALVKGVTEEGIAGEDEEIPTEGLPDWLLQAAPKEVLDEAVTLPAAAEVAAEPEAAEEEPTKGETEHKGLLLAGAGLAGAGLVGLGAASAPGPAPETPAAAAVEKPAPEERDLKPAAVAGVGLAGAAIVAETARPEPVPEVKTEAAVPVITEEELLAQEAELPTWLRLLREEGLEGELPSEEALAAAAAETGAEAGPVEPEAAEAEPTKGEREHKGLLLAGAGLAGAGLVGLGAASAPGPAPETPPAIAVEKPAPEEEKDLRPVAVAGAGLVGAALVAEEVGRPTAEVPPMTEEGIPAEEDDLTLIEGIGPKVALLLNVAGITTFDQLAAADPAHLKEILRIADLQMMDPTTWPEQAKLAADGKMAELAALQAVLKGGRRPPDDLTAIEGIGPKVESLLNEAGITRFDQLAAADPARLKEILRAADLPMMDPTTWPEQAKLAADGRLAELAALQAVLKGGRRPPDDLTAIEGIGPQAAEPAITEEELLAQEAELPTWLRLLREEGLEAELPSEAELAAARAGEPGAALDLPAELPEEVAVPVPEEEMPEWLRALRAPEQGEDVAPTEVPSPVEGAPTGALLAGAAAAGLMAEIEPSAVEGIPQGITGEGFPEWLRVLHREEFQEKAPAGEVAPTGSLATEAPVEAVTAVEPAPSAEEGTPEWLRVFQQEELGQGLPSEEALAEAGLVAEKVVEPAAPVGEPAVPVVEEETDWLRAMGSRTIDLPSQESLAVAGLVASETLQPAQPGAEEELLPDWLQKAAREEGLLSEVNATTSLDTVIPGLQAEATTAEVVPSGATQPPQIEKPDVPVANEIGGEQEDLPAWLRVFEDEDISDQILPETSVEAEWGVRLPSEAEKEELEVPGWLKMLREDRLGERSGGLEEEVDVEAEPSAFVAGAREEEAASPWRESLAAEAVSGAQAEAPGVYPDAEEQPTGMDQSTGLGLGAAGADAIRRMLAARGRSTKPQPVVSEQPAPIEQPAPKVDLSHLFACGPVDEASIRNAEQILKDNPKDRTTRWTLVQAYATVGNHPAAIEHSHQLIQSGEYVDQVAAYLETITNWGVTSRQAYQVLGDAYFKSDRLPEALGAYRKALSLLH